MNNKRENEIRKTMQEVKWYREKIVDMVSQIEDVWILKVIYNFVIGMKKEGE